MLETCTGGGFTTIALAKYALHVYSVEIDKSRSGDAAQNARIARLAEKITLINSDIFEVPIRSLEGSIDAALIDPDWSDSERDQ